MATTDDKKPKYFKDVEKVACKLGTKKDGTIGKQMKGWSLSGKTLFTVTMLGDGACSITITKVSEKPWPKEEGGL